MGKRKLIVDCDTGIDDAHAILMALYDDTVEVIAITTVFGNTTAENTTNNTIKVLQVAGRLDIPVFKGCSESVLGVPSGCDGFMGIDGMGDAEGYDLLSDYKRNSEHASLALLRLINEYPGELTLIGIGPLTNIAVALKIDPNIGKKIKEAFFMGGNIYGYGNVTICQEFNFYADREAAYIVLNTLGCPITLIPLETCSENCFSWGWYDEFVLISTGQSNFVKSVYEKLVKREKEQNALKFTPIWDQLCMAVALNNEVAAEKKHVYATVELSGSLTRGQMVVDWNKKLSKDPNVNLVTKVNMDLFSSLMFQGINAKNYKPKNAPM